MISLRCSVLELPKWRVTRTVRSSFHFPSAMSDGSICSFLLWLRCIALLFIYWLVIILRTPIVWVGRKFLNWSWGYIIFIFVYFLYSIIYQLSILLQIKFFVVAYWGVYDLGRIKLILGIVELGKVGMLEDLISCWSLLRIELQHSR